MLRTKLFDVWAKWRCRSFTTTLKYIALQLMPWRPITFEYPRRLGLTTRKYSIPTWTLRRYKYTKFKFIITPADGWGQPLGQPWLSIQHASDSAEDIRRAAYAEVISKDWHMYYSLTWLLSYPYHTYIKLIKSIRSANLKLCEEWCSR